MEAVFQQCIAEMKSEGRTVLLSSHILAEVEALCDRLSIIRAGRVVQSGTLADLRHLTRTTIVADLALPADGLSDLTGVHDLVVEDHRVRFDVDDDQIEPVMRRLADQGIRSLSSQPPTLEELFLRHYGDELAPQHDTEVDEAGARR
jgi:ABC-2 type transport system ATP-binding protein